MMIMITIMLNISHIYQNKMENNLIVSKPGILKLYSTWHSSVIKAQNLFCIQQYKIIVDDNLAGMLYI